MIDEFVKFKTALLAKQKGFDENCFSWYSKDEILEEIGEDIMYVSNSTFETPWFKENYYTFATTAPTQSLLQRWLREKGIIVESVYSKDPTSERNYYYIIKFTIENTTISYYYDIHKWNYTYEEALEAGLLEGLELVSSSEEELKKKIIQRKYLS